MPLLPSNPTAEIYIEEFSGNIILAQAGFVVNTGSDEKSSKDRFMELKAIVDAWYSNKKAAQDRTVKRIWSYWDGKPMYNRGMSWDSPGKYLSE